MGTNYHNDKTKLTTLELRWLKNAYKHGIIGSGYRTLTKKINEGRIKAGKDTVSYDILRYAIIRMNKGVELVTTDTTPIKYIQCPKCGHQIRIKK